MNTELALFVLTAGQGVVITLLVGDRILLKRNISSLEREVHELHEDFRLMRRELIERMHHVEHGAGL